MSNSFHRRHIVRFCFFSILMYCLLAEEEKKDNLGKKIAKDYFTAFVPTLKFWCSGEGEERELIRFVENKAGK